MAIAARVYKKNVAGPSTHAIVIGVGNYPHLPGGKAKKKFPGSGGMTQLKSPPQSARAVARWLIEKYSHPEKPLASVSLLLSDATDAGFTYSVSKKEKTVEVLPATMPEVAKATREWRDIGDANPKHLLLFYFCGHGIARGPDLSLLLSDFGATKVAPLDGAIDFRHLRQGMDECAAREQCYFLDACRVGSELLIKADGYAGNPIIQSVGAINASGVPRQAPVFYSTLSGGLAYAKPGQPSLFTQALLEALEGAGAGDEEGPWRVRTNLLHDALSFIVMDASERLRVPQLQIAPSDDLSSIKLNEITSPRVPVVVTCSPETANARATLTCENETLKKTRKPKNESWRLQLPAASYEFAAKIKTRDTKISRSIRPTYRRINLDVKK